MRKFFTGILFGLVLLPISMSGQELNCNIQVNYQKISSVNQDVFEKMQSAIWEFVNNQRWTKDQFKPEEKIDCNIFININEAISTTLFTATFSVQSTRPLYGTNYESTILNIIDKNITFEYQEGQPLYFVENSFTSNLASVLAFYSYIIIGFDYDSYAPNGGSKYFDKANEITTYAQQAPEQYQSGWTLDSKNSRYELIQDLTNSQFASFRSYLYQYHRNGMDSFAENPGAMRQKTLNILQDHQKIFLIKQQSMLLRIFFMSKSQELINVFSKATSTEKEKFLKLVGEMDASNLSKYQKINQTK